MIEYLIGVDGGGSGTRVRLARRDGSELARGQGGPSALAHGIDQAWRAIDAAVNQAFAAAVLARPPARALAIGLGLAGVHNKQWAQRFVALDPGYGALVLETDAFTTLMGAHGGHSGAIVAIGTGSVGEALLANGERREVGGWGFPSGDEASGAWLGLRAVGLAQQVLDARRPSSAFAQALIDACGGARAALLVWLGQATQTDYASLAPLVLAHGASDAAARALLMDAGEHIGAIAAALDPTATLPLALCGGLGEPLRAYLAPALRARTVAPQGDAAAGALRMIALHCAQDAP
ncbi:MAG: BadF/BadG/BcrA/BcrD ATPase family protein [Pseudomonadota bacterium]